MPTEWQRGDTRLLYAPIDAAKAVSRGGMIGLSAGTVVNASDETWAANLATTRRNFVAKFAGIAGQTKAANSVPLGSGGTNASTPRLRIDAGGVFSFTGTQVTAGTYAIGTLVGPAKASGNALTDDTIEVVTDPEQAIGKVVGGEGTNPTRLEVEAWSRSLPPAAMNSPLSQLGLNGLKTLAAAGRNGAGAITLTGAAVGDRVAIVFGAPTAGGALVAPAAGVFEASITVVDQVQQVSASNLSANTYVFILLPALATT